jgi:MFS family permease
MCESLLVTPFLTQLIDGNIPDINNAGSIAQALFAHGNAGYDEAESSAWQAAQVSTISLANCFGRVTIGIIADAVKSRVHVPRSFCMPLVSTFFIMALLLLTAINDVHHLWVASGFIGLAYGFWFGLLPAISIEWFGLGACSPPPFSNRNGRVMGCTQLTSLRIGA